MPCLFVLSALHPFLYFTVKRTVFFAAAAALVWEHSLWRRLIRAPYFSREQQYVNCEKSRVVTEHVPILAVSLQ